MNIMKMQSIFCIILTITSFVFLHHKTDAQSRSNYEFEIKEISPFPAAVHGMAVAKDSTLYFSDTFKVYGNQEAVYSLTYPYTGNIKLTGIKGEGVSGLLWMEDTLYVAFLYENMIKSYDKDFNELQTWAVTSPWNLTHNGENVFAITYTGSILKLGESAIEELVKDLALPFDIVYSNNNSFFVSEQVGVGVSGRVKEISLEGEVIQTLPFDFKNPEGLAIDDDSNIYINDTEAGEIYQYRKEDGSLALITDKYDLPICITEGVDGNILVNTNHNNGILLNIQISKNSIETILGGFTEYKNGMKLIPNPSNGLFQFTFTLEKTDSISINLYDNHGRIVKKLISQQLMQRGNHELQFNLADLSQGIYHLTLIGREFNHSTSLVIE
ncbi:T9SS type A sorting domain-containing protein [Sediminitomix flava]|uniref:Putative secreted protein (Por secretion system target) n=1 Tax=Sediminitomix flava TaxID=379075 RepID=A0A315Z9D2_SEDFL|nr:T9SS type A sorting domain-containing protein [Sediminitomix flava]PWJ41882.1 putative secreted protein (Por secretion system target) [Sediminitomix flava]